MLEGFYSPLKLICNAMLVDFIHLSRIIRRYFTAQYNLTGRMTLTRTDGICEPSSAE